MTPDNLITRVQSVIGRSGDTELDTDILYALNRVQREIVLLINFQELLVRDVTSLSLTADTTNYDLPADFLKMSIVWDNNRYEREMMRISPSEYKQYLADIDTDTVTNPEYYDIHASESNVKQIWLFPLRGTIPTGSITAFANYGGTVAGTIKATDTDHGLVDGNTITITTVGGSDYAGTYTVVKIDDDNFYFTATWDATGTATWVKKFYIPFMYHKKVDDLTAGGAANVLSTYYPDLYIEGAAYYVYRDAIYRDQPEKIAFRKAEYMKQVEIVKVAQRQTDRIGKVRTKRVLPSRVGRVYNTQYTGYTS